MKTRCQLFKDVLIQLDSAAGEASEQGAEELADYILDVLIPLFRMKCRVSLIRGLTDTSAKRHSPGPNGVDMAY